MILKLQDQVALVTGGAKRVGRAIVLALCEAGCDVAIHCHHSRADAKQLVSLIEREGRRAIIVEGDLATPSTWPAVVEQTASRLGRLDILVNNASAFLTGEADTVAGFDADRWESMMRVNLVAPMALAHHARVHLAAHSRGIIVNLCDIAAERPWPGHLAYSASKAALAALTKGLARALAPDIRVNGVAPGIAVFPEVYSADLRRKLTDKVPLQRSGTPEEVAALVRFLVESGDYITGQIVAIDGGRSLR